MTIRDSRTVHLVGIGGAGISALASLLLAAGKRVTGSDLVQSSFSATLSAAGALIAVGAHRPANVPVDTELVVASNAIEKTNPELATARRRRLRVLSYSQALAELLVDQKVIAVAGTHGKSTTSGLAATLLVAAKFDPTVVVGASVPILSGNARSGGGTWAVVEADEYRHAFLSYRPTITILTTVEAEHLDFYRTFDRVKSAFGRFVRQLSPGGHLIYNADDPAVAVIARAAKRMATSYGIANRAAIRATNVKLTPSGSTFRVAGKRFVLGAPGRHNVSNALAVIALAHILRIPIDAVARTFARFKGVGRRFEFCGSFKGAAVFNDYAHHPTEVRATIATARLRAQSRLFVVFQPHHHHRTLALFDDFARSLALADRVLLAPIYAVAGRENPAVATRVSSDDLARAIDTRGTMATSLPNNEAIVHALSAEVRPGDTVVVMGAGSINEIVHSLVRP